MQFDLVKNSQIITQILSKVQLLPQTKGEFVISALVHLCTTCTYTTLMWIEVILTEDVEEIANVLYMALTETALIVKILSLWRHSNIVHYLYKEWQQNEIFFLRSPKEYQIWQHEFRTFKQVSFVYIACSFSAASFRFVAVLFLTTYTLPFGHWTPFNWRNPHFYWYAYGYGVIAMSLTCLSNCTLDMFFCYLLKHLTVCFHIEALRLENLDHDLTNSKTLFKEIAQLHNVLRSMCKQCEVIISYPILAQILFSALVLCLSIYRFQNINIVETPLLYLAMVQYAFAMIAQIYLPCYYGNELTLKASTLSMALYTTNWIELSYIERKQIVMFMHYLSKTIILKAGSFFDIGLPVFTKTINNAYTLFALMVNMKKETKTV